MNKYMTATDARKNFYSVIQDAQKSGVRITITREGLPKVVVMSLEEFEGWQETMDILSDPVEVAAIRAALKEKNTTVSLKAFQKSLAL